ncbi:MAG TPA: FAD:protein FMN transferase [Actinomycetota bacterium]|nr:FAD:protein FMN transferase [Actinomycetota bacterium]
MNRFPFRAMGTTVQVLGPPNGGFGAAARTVRERFEREEQRFSRFRSDSELTVVNRSAGRPTCVSETFASVVALALASAERTGGLFDPTVHDAMVAAGYDRDFDDILSGARGRLQPVAPCGRWREVVVDDHTISLPAGLHLDLGGLVKGWAADVAAEEALASGIPWVLVNAGGDLRMAGRTDGIDVGVEDPRDPERCVAMIRLSRGALATSSTCSRAWGDGLHHLIDPRTFRPATSDVIQATVWAESCADAEVDAKAALLAGGRAAGDRACILVTTNDEIVISMPTLEAA